MKTLSYYNIIIANSTRCSDKHTLHTVLDSCFVNVVSMIFFSRELEHYSHVKVSEPSMHLTAQLKFDTWYPSVRWNSIPHKKRAWMIKIILNQAKDKYYNEFKLEHMISFTTSKYNVVPNLNFHILPGLQIWDLFTKKLLNY